MGGGSYLMLGVGGGGVNILDPKPQDYLVWQRSMSANLKPDTLKPKPYLNPNK